jgi:hypothetical protein
MIFIIKSSFSTNPLRRTTFSLSSFDGSKTSFEQSLAPALPLSASVAACHEESSSTKLTFQAFAETLNHIHSINPSEKPVIFVYVDDEGDEIAFNSQK